MLDSIQRFFQQALVDPAPEHSTLTLELAAATLLCEVVRADYRRNDAELTALRDTLKTRYKLSDTAVEELMSLAEQEVEEAVDYYRFVSLLNEHYTEQQRFALVESMCPPYSSGRPEKQDGEWYPPMESISSAKNTVPRGHSPWVKAYLPGFPPATAPPMFS